MRLISTDKCIEGMMVAKTIQLANDNIVINKNMRLKQRCIEKIKETGITHIYITNESFCEFIIQDCIKEETRQEIVMLIHKQISNLNHSDNLKIEKLEIIIKDIINQILSTENLILNLLEIRSIDDYTFIHSINVGILSMITGIIMNFSRHTLLDLGLGAILHDIGKTRVPLDILNKRGRLTDKEYSEIKKHTLKGFDIIQNSGKLNEDSSSIALNHHERYDGKGYPNGLKGEDIPLFSRIVSVMDVYDALTNNRVYRPKVKKNEAIDYIISMSDKQFDPNIVKSLTSNISAYSIGQGILLSTGQKGYILNISSKNPTRPLVRITHNVNGKKLNRPYNINLIRKIDIKIIESIEIDDV